jgi:cytochrome c-type biogenesis protein CcmE
MRADVGSHTMMDNRTRIPVVVATVLIIAAIGVLFYYAVWMAVVLFVVLAAVVAINTGRRQGLRRGLWQFLKDMILGW